MRYILLFVAGISISATCHKVPYNGQIICTNQQSDCSNIKIEKNLNIKINSSAFSIEKKKLTFGIFCSLMNTNDTIKRINRGDFSLLSTKGLQFKILPFKAMINDKLKQFSDTLLLVPQGLLKDYVLLFSSSNNVGTEKRQKQHLLTDSVILLYTNHRRVDTLAKFALENRK